DRRRGTPRWNLLRDLRPGGPHVDLEPPLGGLPLPRRRGEVLVSALEGDLDLRPRGFGRNDPLAQVPGPALQERLRAIVHTPSITPALRREGDRRGPAPAPRQLTGPAPLPTPSSPPPAPQRHLNVAVTTAGHRPEG